MIKKSYALIKPMVITVMTILAMCCITQQAHATHATGADLFYQCLGNNQYKITITFYRDCAGIQEDNSYFINISSSTLGVDSNIIVPKAPQPNGQIITQDCPTAVSRCLGGTAVGIRKWRYEKIITLPGSANDWVIGWRECNRNFAITTVNNPGSYCTYIEAHLDNSNGLCNSSPYFSNIPIVFACVNQFFNYNQGAVDIDGDSLYYELVNPRHNDTVMVPLLPPYLDTVPLSSSTPFLIDHESGAINFLPNLIQVGVLAVRCTEYRNGMQIGSIMRDFQFYIQNCKTNNVPTVSGFNGTNSYTTDMCLGDSTCWFFNTFDTDTNQHVYLSSNIDLAIPGALFTNDTSFRPVPTVCFKPDTDDMIHSPLFFTFTVFDEFCPNAAAQTFTYRIRVHNFDLSIAETPITCSLGNGELSAVINANVGNVTYTYLWSTGSTAKKIKNLAPGTYTVTVTSSIGCVETKSYILSGPSAVVSTSFTPGSNTTCVPCNGAIIEDIEHTEYTYLWNNGATTNSVSALCGGAYTVTVSDVYGCTATYNYTVNDSLPVISCAISSNPNTFCNQNCNGDATAAASGGTGYSYIWSNGGTTATTVGLCSGAYTVTVTDVSGCTSSCSITLTDNTESPGCSIQKTDEVCVGAANGTASAVATAGVAPYTYLWSNGATNTSINNLSPGSYAVTITDSHGCTSQCSTTINAAANFGITASTTPSQCNSCNGTASTQTSGGNGPYAYLWSNGANSSTLSGLCSGAYTVTVTDALGCTATAVANVADAYETIACTVNKTNVTCNGGKNGAVAVNVTQGTAPFTYLWSTGAITAGIGNLGAGTYTVTVSNINGCSSSCQATITQPAAVGCMVTVAKHAKCGDCSGSLIGDKQNTPGAVTYSWSNGSNTKTITNLCAGTYTVTVTNSKGCTSSCSNIILNNTLPLQITSTVANNNGCNGTCNGSIAISVSGGTSYAYLWSNGNTTANPTSLCEGFYTVSVTDISGCTATAAIEVKGKTTNINVSITNQTIQKCNAPCTGKLKAVPSGGTQYTYAWSTSVVKTTQTISSLCAATYTVTVTDVTGCNKTASYQLLPFINTLSCGVITTHNTSCNLNACNGTGLITVNSGSGNYAYQWATSNLNTTSFANNLCGGSYTVTVTDLNTNCTSTCFAKLEDIGVGPVCSIQILQNIKCNGGNNGSLKVNVAGNSGPYKYIWSNGTTTDINTTLVKGTYTVTVTDALGCSSTCSKVLTQPTNLNFTGVVSAATCLQPCNGRISVSVNGGVAPYTYIWSNSTNNTNKDTALCPGTYTVTVTDAKGCTKMYSATVVNNAQTCSTFLSGARDHYVNPPQGGNAVSNYFNANFATLFPTGIVLKGSCVNAKELTLTNIIAVKEILKGTGAPTTLTTNYTDPLIGTLNNSLAAQVTVLFLNIQFDALDANWAPSSTVQFKDLVVDSGPLTGLTVQQVYDNAVNALTGCGSAYSNALLRTYCALINSSWHNGVKTNNVVKCPPLAGCGNKDNPLTLFPNDLLQFNVFPNPNDGEFVLQFVASDEHTYTMDIYDNSGRLVYQYSGVSVTGMNKINIAHTAFAEGIYQLRFRVNGETRQTKLMIK